MARRPPAVTIRKVATHADLKAAFPVMRELRQHLDFDAFLAAVETQRAEHYALAALHADGRVCAVAGYRIMHMLVSGRVMYVDDFVTAAAIRDQGFGKLLFDWLYREAGRLGCERIDLDSGVHRHGAHGFYLNRRMAITAHHFSIDVG